MPENPNNPNPQRTAPATKSEQLGMGPMDPELEANELAAAGLPVPGEEAEPKASNIITENITTPETVKAVEEMLTALQYTVEDISKIEQGFSNWSEGLACATLTVGSEEFVVSPDSDTTHALALALVKNDLETEPSIFNQDFLRSYIDLDRIKNDLRADVEEQTRDNLRENWRYEFKDEDDLDEDGNVKDDVFEARVEQETDNILSDPLGYLNDIFGEEGPAKAMEIGGINIEEAAEDAVSADGEGHFLSSYDGNIHELPSGGEYWRTN